MLECYIFFFSTSLYISGSQLVETFFFFIMKSWFYVLFIPQHSKPLPNQNSDPLLGRDPPSWKTLIYVDIAFIVLFNTPMPWATLCRWLKWFSSSRGVTSSLRIPVLPHHRKWALTVRKVHSEVFSALYLKLWMVCFATRRLYCVYWPLIGLLLAQVVFFTFLASRY